MFVRVERPRGSKHFVLEYVKCDWVFSFAPRFEQMRVRLNHPADIPDESGVEEKRRCAWRALAGRITSGP